MFGLVPVGLLVLALVYSVVQCQKVLNINDQLIAELKAVNPKITNALAALANAELEITNLREALANAEKMGVFEGLFDLEECGYWIPTAEERGELRARGRLEDGE